MTAERKDKLRPQIIVPGKLEILATDEAMRVIASMPEVGAAIVKLIESFEKLPTVEKE